MEVFEIFIALAAIIGVASTEGDTAKNCEPKFKFARGHGQEYKVQFNSKGPFVDQMVRLSEGSRYLFTKNLSKMVYSDVVGHTPLHGLPSEFHGPGETSVGLCAKLGLEPALPRNPDDIKDLRESLQHVELMHKKNGQTILFDKSAVTMPVGAVRVNERWVEFNTHKSIRYLGIDFFRKKAPQTDASRKEAPHGRSLPRKKSPANHFLGLSNTLQV